MGYSYDNPSGGGLRSLNSDSNVWFYPKIRLVPSSEYSFWGISDTNCLVFDTYFGSNISWTRNGPAGDPEDTTKPPRRIYYKDETTGTTKEAVAVGYAPYDSSGTRHYQSVWVKPQVIKCITSKSYIITIALDSLPDSGDYYMGTNPIIPTEQDDLFFDDNKLSFPWHLDDFTSSTKTSPVAWTDSYFYTKKFQKTRYITYCLSKQVSNIYKYRTFYFIVPTGCHMVCGLRALDFWAYNGHDLAFSTWKDWKDTDRAYEGAQGYYSKIDYSVNEESGGILGDYDTIFNFSTDFQHSISTTKLYDSSATKSDRWAGGFNNIEALSGYSSGNFSTYKYAKAGFDVRDGTLTWYYSGHPTCSGTTINFGEPYNRYMKLVAESSVGYYGYVYKDCESLYGCTLAYNTKSTTGMKDTTVTESTSFSSEGSFSGTTTIQSDHDSSAYYRIIIWYYSFGGSWTRSGNPSEGWCDAMSSKTYSYSGSSATSPYYLIQAVCTNISETELGEVDIYEHQYSNPSAIIGVDTSMNTDYISNVTLYYNSGSSSSKISNSSTYQPTTYNYPVWYVGSVTKITSNTKNWSHSCRQYSRCVCYYRNYNGGWSSLTGTWKYETDRFGSSSDTATWWDDDVTLTCNWNSNGIREQVYFTTDYAWISSPTITKCVDAGKWKRTITVYNPNPISLTLGYTNDKTSSKTSANSGWSTTTLSGYSYTTLAITDQDGFHDNWILCGFQVGNSVFYCNTIDEDPGSVNYVQTNFYYSR